jgi:hypothetical protein
MINLGHQFFILSSGVKFHKNDLSAPRCFFCAPVLTESQHMEHIDVKDVMKQDLRSSGV